MTSTGLKRGAILRHNTYRIERILGQGGFGITYLATDLSLDRLVAIKEFFPKDYCDRVGDTSQISLGTSSSADFVSRLKAKFLKEARNIAKLDHHGIIKIHAAFEENNTAYYVMDFIDGETLSDKIKREGPLSMNKALEYIKKVANALDYIHRQKINHLDLKPANIMLRKSDDSPILIDFGLSKQYDSEGNQTSTTPTGISHGYAPLEQYNDGGVKEFSPQTDIYSLAATLFYLLTGKTPPHATKLIEDSIKFPPEFPYYLKSAVSIGMASARKNRFASVSNFVNALDSEDGSTEYTQLPEKREDPKIETIGRTPSVQHTKTGKSNSSKKISWIIGIVIVAAGLIAMPSLLVKSCDSPSQDVNIADSVAVENVEAEEIPMTIETVENKLMNTSLGECSYTGEIDSEGRPNGHGVAVWSKGDGKKYDGEWVNGNMDGQTTYTQRSGDTFIGTFKNNRYHQGRYTIISSGEYFEGTFKNGQPDKGNWYDKNGKKL